MPTIKLTGAKDMWAGQMIARFENEYSSAQVSTVCLAAGISPSHGILSSPMKDFGPGAYDEYAPCVALKRDGPAGRVLLRTRTEISYYEPETRRSHVLMSGWLVSHSHQFHEDSVVSEIYDDRVELDRITVLGRLVYDPEIEEYYWDLAEACIFNDLGFPNCIDTDLGPVFAPCHRFGYRQQWDGSDTEEPAKYAATSRARSFDCDDGIKYFRLIHWFKTSVALPAMPVDIGYTTLSSYIEWPENAGQVFKLGRKLSMDGGFSCDNMTLLEALQAIARKAGTYDLYIKPLGNFRSEITFLDMGIQDYGALELHLQDYGPYTIDQCLANPSIIKEGFALENGKKYRDNVRIVGDAPSIESVISMWAPNHMQGFPWALIPAWAATDEILFKQYIATGGGNVDLVDTQEAFNIACDIWPWVYAAYRVNPDFSPWIGTKWAGMAASGRIRFKPFLNTWMQGNNQNPRNCQPREIPVDFLNVLGDPRKWLRAQLFDNLTLSPDRTVVIFSGLRAAAQTWYVSDPKGNNKFGVNLKMQPIRLTAALEAHWCIVGAADNDPNGTATRVKNVANSSYTIRAAKDDYSELLRKNSRPIGIADVGLFWSIWPDKCTAGNELFSDRKGDAQNPDADGRSMLHAATRLLSEKRVDPNAAVRICQIAPAYHPGIAVSIKGKNTLKYEGVLKSVKFSSLGKSMQDAKDVAPDTWLEIGPPDVELIGGGLQNGQAVTQGISPKYTGPGEEDDDDDSPHEDKPTETDSGGKGSVQDEYEKAEAAKSAPAKTEPRAPTTAPAVKPPAKSNDAGERMIVGKEAKAAKADNRMANMQDKHDSLDADDAKGRNELEKKMRTEGKKSENATRQAEDARGKDARDKGTGIAGFGKGGSGRMTVQDLVKEKKDGKETGRVAQQERSITDLSKENPLGKVGSGRMERGAPGKSHREWDTNLTSGDPKKIDKDQMPDHSSYDMNKRYEGAELENTSGQLPDDSRAWDSRFGDAGARDPLVAKMQSNFQQNGGNRGQIAAREQGRSEQAMPSGPAQAGPQGQNWWNKLPGQVQPPSTIGGLHITATPPAVTKQNPTRPQPTDE